MEESSSSKKRKMPECSENKTALEGSDTPLRAYKKSALEGMKAEWEHHVGLDVFSEGNSSLSSIELLKAWLATSKSERNVFEETATNRRKLLREYLKTKNLPVPKPSGLSILYDVTMNENEHVPDNFAEVHTAAIRTWNRMTEEEKQPYELKKRQMDEKINTSIREDIAAEMAQDAKLGYAMDDPVMPHYDSDLEFAED